MSERRFSAWAVVLLVLLGVGIAAGSMLSGVVLGYQWGRSSGRARALADERQFLPRGFEPFTDQLPPQILPPEQTVPPRGRAGGQPFLGVSFQMVTAELAQQENLGADQGAWVTQVVPGSPAEKAGLQQGDLILAVDGQELDEHHSLRVLINARRPGETVELMVLHGQRQLKLEVELGTRPESFFEGRLLPAQGLPRLYFQFQCFPGPCPQFEDRP